jgi:hypothetical protein
MPYCSRSSVGSGEKQQQQRSSSKSSKVAWGRGAIRLFPAMCEPEPQLAGAAESGSRKAGEGRSTAGEPDPDRELASRAAAARITAGGVRGPFPN